MSNIMVKPFLRRIGHPVADGIHGNGFNLPAVTVLRTKDSQKYKSEP